MGILQNGLTPRLRPALLFLPFPILLTVAIACFAQPKYEIASPAIDDSLPANSSSPPENEASGAQPGITPGKDLELAAPILEKEDGNAADTSGRETGQSKTTEKHTTVIPPPRSWHELVKQTGGEPVKVDRLPVARDQAPTRLNHDSDRQVVRAAETPGAVPTAVARVIGVASPGLRITLDASESGNDLNFRWIQMRGPKISTNRLDQPRLTFMVPGDAKELAFLMVVYGPKGSDSTVVDVPLVLRPKVSLPPQIYADAGDDQVGLVGHEITLNGARSSPRENARFRWIQAEGPRVASITQDGWFCSFIPTEPGLYRFVLVVAADGTISEPDDVRVTITNELEPGVERMPAPPSRASLPPPVEVVARQSLCALPGGAAAGRQLADSFEGVAQRMDLYESYGDVQHEMSLRLNLVLPPDPMLRNLWNERLFNVLSSRIADVMRREGLELTRLDARAATMTESQKNQLRQVFNAIATGFRTASSQSVSTPRGGAGSPVVADQVHRSSDPKVVK